MIKYSDNMIDNQQDKVEQSWDYYNEVIFIRYYIGCGFIIDDMPMDFHTLTFYSFNMGYHQ